jgi:hypothetical protein
MNLEQTIIKNTHKINKYTEKLQVNPLSQVYLSKYMFYLQNGASLKKMLEKGLRTESKKRKERRRESKRENKYNSYRPTTSLYEPVVISPIPTLSSFLPIRPIQTIPIISPFVPKPFFSSNSYNFEPTISEQYIFDYCNQYTYNEDTCNKDKNCSYEQNLFNSKCYPRSYQSTKLLNFMKELIKNTNRFNLLEYNNLLGKLVQVLNGDIMLDIDKRILVNYIRDSYYTFIINP